MRAVRQIVGHGLEHGGVSSEEPDVLHSAEMRKGCVHHLLVVSLPMTYPVFSPCPLFCELGEVMLREFIQQCPFPAEVKFLRPVRVRNAMTKFSRESTDQPSRQLRFL